MPKDLITVTEAARRLGVTRAWIARLCQQGRIAGARKIGNMWVLPVGAPIKESPPKVHAATRHRVTSIPGEQS